MPNSGGVKFDTGKLRMDLLPMDSLRDVAEIYTFGAKKYADENWRKGLAWKRIYGAVLRHLSAWYLGQDLDEESNLPHLAHAAWGLLTLLNYARTHKELDDRPITNAGGNFVASTNVETRRNQQSSHSEVPSGAGTLVCAPSSPEDDATGHF